MPTARWLALLALTAPACDLFREAEPLTDAAPPGLDGPRPPRDDLVPPLGSATTLDVAAWNIENFPKSERAVRLVADLVTSYDLDLVMVEEVASVDAWDELVALLPEHEGTLSTHRYTATSYQKLGLLYRAGIDVSEPELLFVADTWAFPRPPFKVHVSAPGYDVDLIGVHLKAGGAPEDGDRRALAAGALDGYIRSQIAGGGEPEVIVLGDYNEVVSTAEGRARMAPLLDPDRYRLRTQAAADAGERSFLPTANRVIDHILTTSALDATLGDRPAIIPRPDATVPRYDPDVTDHLPVVLLMPQP